ncbi:toll/interleukin-1 receptor domain-containing protein [Streptomyces sp. NPDC021093]|uniref:toll/interleukin-1 receptor domain-containing protein n=1 Tax=Streptomyces sp. NPDC021093 TaxID=3365112 RepID=UPI00379A35E1
MADVFINYRTGDGDEFATTLERELSRRFGSDRIFRASKSIPPGTLFDEKLLTGVRRSAVLLALVGKDWEASPKLHDPADWVRREILEAFACAIPVVPILIGRRTERLRPDVLPPELERLAHVQSLRYDNQDAERTLGRIGDELAHLVPQFAEAERAAKAKEKQKAEAAGAPPSPGAGSVHSSMGDNSGTAVQARDISGGVHLGQPTTHIEHAHGPVQSGSGAVHAPHLTGDGAQYVAGDNREGIHQTFGARTRREDEGR